MKICYIVFRQNDHINNCQNLFKQLYFQEHDIFYVVDFQNYALMWQKNKTWYYTNKNVFAFSE